MKNLLAILETEGTKPENAVKTLCMLSDISDFAAFNQCMPGILQKRPPEPAWEFGPCLRGTSVKLKS
jgi:enamine deaminase RidA (YjgF/YER057c/UK114 family)